MGSSSSLKGQMLRLANTMASSLATYIRLFLTSVQFPLSSLCSHPSAFLSLPSFHYLLAHPSEPGASKCLDLSQECYALPVPSGTEQGLSWVWSAHPGLHGTGLEVGKISTLKSF